MSRSGNKKEGTPMPQIADDGTCGRISVTGARANNLRNVDVDIPHGALTVVTGLSGSGKSSLAFDTIFAEGQRRYIETFSAYARNMLGSLERPDVDQITGLCPVIAIEQKTVNRNPRSTIGTTTEVYDFLRLLFARIGKAVSYLSGELMVKYTDERIVDLILEKYAGHKIYILAPLVKNRKGHYRELFEQLTRKGFLRVRVDGELLEITRGMKLDRYKNHSVELVVDRVVPSPKDRDRLLESVRKALAQGYKEMMVFDVESDSAAYYSQELMDPATGISYHDPAPHNFSFNSPQGACPCCKGLGYVNIVDRAKIVPDEKLSIAKGAVAPLGKYRDSLIFLQIRAIIESHGYTLDTPFAELSDEAVDDIFNGTTSVPALDGCTMASFDFFRTFDGILKFIETQQDDDAGYQARKWSGQFISRTVCPQCKGDRLNREALHFYVDGHNIAELSRMDIGNLSEWAATVLSRLDSRDSLIAAEIIKEISTRLRFLCDVGLHYLQLNRASATLSGGESQRIRLATQLGSELVNVLYILDEPSIGLHQSDNHRLIESLKRLRDASNSIIVVEHDKDIMLQADYVVDIGPGAGRKGGKVVFAGTPEQLLASDTLTAGYLNGTSTIATPAQRRAGNGKRLTLGGCTGHNLKDIDFTVPLGTLTVVAGISGSGKSSVVNGTLQPILSRHFYNSIAEPLPCRFSFNVAGGRCPACSGNGYRTIEMNFLPDVLVPCEVCHGKRYNRETLEVRFKGKSIADVLDMTVNQAVEFFAGIPAILRKIKVLQDIGLGYIKLGQPSSTLSGGENQRVKLATELAKRDTGKTLFILDEPTTGLHFDDIRTLLDILNRLVDKGNTVLVIEHNLDVIRCADHIIDMGPAGGSDGGRIIATGTPEEVAASDSPTAPYLRDEGITPILPINQS